MVRVQVVKEVAEKTGDGYGALCLQWCRYFYDDGNMEQGYRFIWRRPDGKLQPARGQARIPSLEYAIGLIDKAIKAGWGYYEGEKVSVQSAS